MIWRITKTKRSYEKDTGKEHAETVLIGYFEGEREAVSQLLEELEEYGVFWAEVRPRRVTFDDVQRLKDAKVKYAVALEELRQIKTEAS